MLESFKRFLSSKGEESYIEVKATSGTNYDILLTVNEFRSLRNKQDK